MNRTIQHSSVPKQLKEMRSQDLPDQKNQNVPVRFKYVHQGPMDSHTIQNQGDLS